MMLFSVACVQAQDEKDFKNTTPEQRAQVQTSLLKSKLQLNDDQTAKVSAINLKYAKEMEPVLKGSGGKFAKLKEAKKINEKKEAEYKQVLTPEQFTKYEQVKSEMKEEMKQKMKDRKQQ
jgi:predicted fused transcriptional regulator/phosphomethylpyrimidine kinase